MRSFAVLLATSMPMIAFTACAGGTSSAPALPAAAGFGPAQTVRAVAAARSVTDSQDVAVPDTLPNVAGTYVGTVEITRGGKTDDGTMRVVVTQSGADISGTNDIDTPALRTSGTEAGTVARTPPSGAAVDVTFADRHGIGTGTVAATLLDGELSVTGVEFYVYGRPAGTLSFDVKRR